MATTSTTMQGTTTGQQAPTLAHSSQQTQQLQQEPLQTRGAQPRTTVIGTSLTPLMDLPPSHPALRPLQPATQIEQFSPAVTRMEHAPVVRERVLAEETEEIQPIIERERIRQEIRPIVYPAREYARGPVHYLSRDLPLERREMVEKGAETVPWVNTVSPAPTVVQPVHRTVVKQPVVREIIRPRIIEQIQPVIDREIQETTVIKTIKPVQEVVFESPRIAAPIYHATASYHSPQYVQPIGYQQRPALTSSRQPGTYTKQPGYAQPQYQQRQQLGYGQPQYQQRQQQGYVQPQYQQSQQPGYGSQPQYQQRQEPGYGKPQYQQRQQQGYGSQQGPVWSQY